MTMTEDEKDRIARKAREEAGLENRVKNLEDEIGELRTGITWGIRAIWGGVAYLLMQLWTFISQGGSLK